MGVEVVTYRACKTCKRDFRDPGAGKRAGVPAGFCSARCYLEFKDEEKPVRKQRTAPMRSGSQGSQKRRPVSRASKEQREAKTPCLVTGSDVTDQAHLWPRGMGGCSDALCTVSLCRSVHQAFDAGEFDVLPYLIAHGRVAEIQHALEHANGDVVALVERLTGCRANLQPRTRLLTVEDIERRNAA